MSLPCLGLEEGLVDATEELCTERGVSHTLSGWGPAPWQCTQTVPGAVGLVTSAQRELCCPKGLVRDVQHSNKLLSMHQSYICRLILAAKETVACSCSKILLQLSLRFLTPDTHKVAVPLQYECINHNSSDRQETLTWLWRVTHIPVPAAAGSWLGARHSLELGLGWLPCSCWDRAGSPAQNCCCWWCSHHHHSSWQASDMLGNLN